MRKLKTFDNKNILIEDDESISIDTILDTLAGLSLMVLEISNKINNGGDNNVQND